METIIFFLLTFLLIQSSIGQDVESSTQIGGDEVDVTLLQSILIKFLLAVAGKFILPQSLKYFE